MRFVRGFLFVVGLMFFGVTIKMEPEGNELITIFIFYGFFGVSVIIAWYEVRRLLLELRKG